MRVVLSGYYGFGNLGDEALLEVIVARLRARFDGVEIDVLSATPQKTASAFGVEATPRWDMGLVRASIERADVVLSGGGGLLQSATSARSALYYASILREAVKVRRKSMIFAQSIGPLDLLGRFIVKRMCRGVDRATVRDERSRDLLASLIPATPVDLTADPVFLYDLPAADVDLAAEGLGPAPYAIVSVRKIAAFKNGVSTIARAVDALDARHGIRSAFLPLGGPADAEVSTTVIRACTSAPMLLPECSLARAAAIISQARVVVGMRLHALILAARFAVPFLAVPYDPKVDSLCADLQYPLDPLWTPGRAIPAAAGVDAIVDRLVNERESIAGHLARRVEDVRAAAERNFAILGELMGEP